MPFDRIAPDRHAARWSELRKAAAMAWLSKCDEPPAEATHAAAKRALGGGRHLPCATYYAYEAERAESMARDCRQRERCPVRRAVGWLGAVLAGARGEDAGREGVRMKPLTVAAIVVGSPFAAVAFCWAGYLIVTGWALVLIILQALLGWA